MNSATSVCRGRVRSPKSGRNSLSEWTQPAPSLAEDFAAAFDQSFDIQVARDERRRKSPRDRGMGVHRKSATEHPNESGPA